MALDGLLPAAGLVPADLPARTLRVQHKVVLAALLGTVLTHASAAETRAYMSVTAHVVDTIGVSALHQARAIEISASDIERGFVEIAAASRVEVRNPRPSVFQFRGVGSLFSAVRITSAAGMAEFGPAGGTLLAKPDGTGLSNVSLDYRFELNPGTQPGRHRWPLALTVLPL